MGSEDSKRIIETYFNALSTGEPELATLLTDDVTWWVPQGSDLSGLKEGKKAVLEFLGGGVGYYAEDEPLQIQIVSMIAEEGRVACEFTIEATTARGKPYKNYYHFAFEVEGDQICAVREYLDTHYAHLAFHGEAPQA